VVVVVVANHQETAASRMPSMPWHLPCLDDLAIVMASVWRGENLYAVFDSENEYHKTINNCMLDFLSTHASLDRLLLLPRINHSRDSSISLT
jgi:hypothetical protein